MEQGDDGRINQREDEGEVRALPSKDTSSNVVIVNHELENASSSGRADNVFPVVNSEGRPTPPQQNGSTISAPTQDSSIPTTVTHRIETAAPSTIPPSAIHVEPPPISTHLTTSAAAQRMMPLIQKTTLAPSSITTTIVHNACAADPASASSKQQNRKRGVPHVYRDYSSVPDTAGYVRKKTGGVTQPFPEKLHELLERENEPSVISWLPHGRAFLVRKPKEFTNYVMPKYFRQTKLTSFQRQLNLYGFRRITQGPDGGAYYHELFLRGRPQLCMRMQRQKVKGTGHKQPADAQTEPNFYSMPSSQAAQVGGATAVASAATAATVSVTEQHSQQEGQHPPPQPHIGSEMSPGLEGVHGAAALLKNMAGGSKVPFSLGASAEQGTIPAQHPPPSQRDMNTPGVVYTSYSSQPYASSPPQRVSAVNTQKRILPTLLPTPSGGAPSMSLLGRIAQSPNSVPAATARASSSSPVSSSPPQHSTFFWPPVRQAEAPPPPTPLVHDSSAATRPSIFGAVTAVCNDDNNNKGVQSSPDSNNERKVPLSSAEPAPGNAAQLQPNPNQVGKEQEIASGDCLPSSTPEVEANSAVQTKDTKSKEDPDANAVDVQESSSTPTALPQVTALATAETPITDSPKETEGSMPSDDDDDDARGADGREQVETNPSVEITGQPTAQPKARPTPAIAKKEKEGPPSKSCADSTAEVISSRGRTKV